MSSVNIATNKVNVNFNQNQVFINQNINKINVDLRPQRIEVFSKKNEIKIDVVGRVVYNNIPVNYTITPPTTRNSPGQVGQLASDDDSMYFCFKPNTWAFWRLIKGW